MKFKKIFITVGTTNFDSLIATLTSEEGANALQFLGCTQLTVQFGNGVEFNSKNIESRGIFVNKFRLKPSILDEIKWADLVISHAGAGSCIEVLREHKPLVVVVNEKLMDNHQTELAKQLCDDGYLVYCTTKTLCDTVQHASFEDLKPYTPGNMKEFIKSLDKLMGFTD